MPAQKSVENPREEVGAGLRTTGQTFGQDDDRDFEDPPQELLAGLEERPPLAHSTSLQTCPCCVAAALAHDYAFQDFPVRLHDRKAWIDPETSVTRIVIRLRLRGPRDSKVNWGDTFSQYMNPLRWSDDRNGYFRGSRALRATIQEKKGAYTGWSGEFLERVSWSQGPMRLSAFENLLDVDFTVFEASSRSVLKLVYKLRETLFSEVVGWRQRGGLDIDDGYALVWRNSGTGDTFVEVFKKIRFTRRPAPQLPGNVDLGRLLNLTAATVVGAWLDSLVYRTAESSMDREGVPQSTGRR